MSRAGSDGPFAFLLESNSRLLSCWIGKPSHPAALPLPAISYHSHVCACDYAWSRCPFRASGSNITGTHNHLRICLSRITTSPRVLAWNTKRRVLDVDSVPPGRAGIGIVNAKEKTDDDIES
jgi:hypothetical protein